MSRTLIEDALDKNVKLSMRGTCLVTGLPYEAVKWALHTMVLDRSVRKFGSRGNGYYYTKVNHV